MEKEKQSWYSCKYALPVERETGLRLKLEKQRFYETYNCLNPEMVKSEIYPIKKEGTNDIAEIFDSDGAQGLHRSLHLSSIFDILEREALEDCTPIALRGCEHCRFYERKDEQIKKYEKMKNRVTFKF